MSSLDDLTVSSSELILSEDMCPSCGILVSCALNQGYGRSRCYLVLTDLVSILKLGFSIAPTLFCIWLGCRVSAYMFPWFFFFFPSLSGCLLVLYSSYLFSFHSLSTLIALPFFASPSEKIVYTIVSFSPTLCLLSITQKSAVSNNVGRNIHWYIHYGEQYGGSLKN